MLICRHRIIALVPFVALALAHSASAQDYQIVAVGNGLANSQCVVDGGNFTLESSPSGDDVVLPFTTDILSGPNGICESLLSGDDIRPPNGVVLGSGAPFGRIIIAGHPDQSNNGICDTLTSVAGDDVLVLLPGTSTPRQVGVRRGANNTLDTTPSGDDVVATIICPGGDLVLNSTPAGDDFVAVNAAQCAEICPFASACIIPGADDILDSTVNGADEARMYISTGANGISQTAKVGDDEQRIAVGNGQEDATCVNAGADGIAQTSLCGEGTTDVGEECDDGVGNSDTTPDACRTDCRAPFCGDGIVDPGNGESCEDSNTKNNDDCVLPCVIAVCGDGFKKTKGTPPFEQCDDGNVSPGDGCDGTCEQEDPIDCGNGIADPPYCSSGLTGACSVDADCDTSLGAGDGVCTTEACDDGNNSDKDDCRNNCTLPTCGDGSLHSTGTPPFEECDDGNTSPGDGCSGICENECGNGVIDGACSQGTLNDPCNVDSDCDTFVGAGDGVCITEPCDIGLDGLCLASPPTCSAVCTIASCGNGEVECAEQCDLGSGNGLPGSGCTALCERTLVGASELKSGKECPGAWTMDSPPQDLKYRKQTCTDGAFCDFDTVVNGECVFSVGMCVNRPEPAGCVTGPVLAVDIPRLDTSLPWAAAAGEALTDALGMLTSDSFDAPGRCRDGRARKNCTFNVDCDSYLGAGDGICDVATGVAYLPPLDAFGGTPNQLVPCTAGQPVTVPVGERLNMRSYVRREMPLKGDRDNIRLYCLAP